MVRAWTENQGKDTTWGTCVVKKFSENDTVR